MPPGPFSKYIQQTPKSCKAKSKPWAQWIRYLPCFRCWRCCGCPQMVAWMSLDLSMSFAHGLRLSDYPWYVFISISTMWGIIHYTATSVDVERLFSKGCILLPHLCNCLSAQLTHALLCLGSWSQLGFVKNEDIKKVVRSNAEDEESADEDIYWVVIMFYLDTYCPIRNEYLCFDWEPYPPWVKTLEPMGMTQTLSWRVRVFCG